MSASAGFLNVHLLAWFQQRVDRAMLGRVTGVLMFASLGLDRLRLKNEKHPLTRVCCEAGGAITVFSTKHLFAFAALLSLGVTSAAVAADKQINDDVGVNAVVHGFEDAWNRHDMDAFAMLFAADADFVNVIGMRWVGRDAIKQHHAASHATIFKSSTLKIGNTTVRFLKADVATARSEWTLSGITSGTGQIAPIRTGILTHVLERIDGHWQIVLTQNTDIAKPGG